MKCSICGSLIPKNHRFCSQCGSPAPHRRSAHWPPVIIMAVMVVIGLSLFLITTLGGIPFTDTPAAIQTDTPWFYMDGNTLYFDPDCYTGGSELTIPDTVEDQAVLALGDFCFRGCEELSTIILPYSLQEIGNNAFSDCSSLRAVYVPESVLQIGDSAFANCSALESVWLPYTLTGIGSDAFENCDNLNYVFFTGKYEFLEELYPQISDVDAYFSCSDGIYFQ